ncbi:MAG TPA: cytochrome c biogenesis protein CcdA [Chthonomonadaceae bacterium]|nr:cytochrome c biogenesis protein CcdA [Chthonomonadaceae bacterium]
MRALRNLAWIFVFACVALAGKGQPPVEQPVVHWKAELRPAVVRAGEHAQVALIATIDAPWHIYSLKVAPDANTPTTIQVAGAGALASDGSPVQPNPKSVLDSNFGKEVEYYEKGVAFGAPVVVSAGPAGDRKATVTVRAQACKEGQCRIALPVDVPVKFRVEAGAVRPEYAHPITAAPAQPSTYQNYPAPGAVVAPAGAPPAGALAIGDQTARQIAEAKRKGVLNFLLLSFGFGLAALLTPCVFPMIPITVSFFAKKQEEGPARTDLRGAFAYCAGIIGTFTGLGLLMTAIFGPASINRLAQSPWTNAVFAILFIVLAANLFGVFEVAMPSWLVDKAQAGKSAGGWLGPLAMGSAFTLTTFTCTVGFIGTVLVQAAQGDWFYPAIGMLAFSAAFALPFFFLALFPQLLARVPKSGAWMISVKAFMGFLELAAALKFISNFDLSLQLGFLTRPVFLAIWAALAVVAGLYLLGWLRIAADTSKRFGPARRAIGCATLVVGIWVLSAINGSAPDTLAAFLPPDPYPYKDGRGPMTEANVEHNWDRALARAAAEHKPIFVNFTGDQCTNCRKMENGMLKRPDVHSLLDMFVRVDLTTDRPTAESQRYEKLLFDMEHVTTLPCYVLTRPDGKPTGPSSGFTDDAPQFVGFLREGFRVSAPDPAAPGGEQAPQRSASR